MTVPTAILSITSNVQLRDSIACILPRHSGVLRTRTRQLVLLMHGWSEIGVKGQFICSSWGSPRLELHSKGDCELGFV